MTKWRPSRQGVVIGCVLSTAWATVWLAMAGAQCRAVEAGFWFEPGAFALSPAATEQIGGHFQPTR